MGADNWICLLMADAEQVNDWDQLEDIFVKLSRYAEYRNQSKIMGELGQAKWAVFYAQLAQDVYNTLPDRAQWEEGT